MIKNRVAPQLLTTSNSIGPWYHDHAALLFSGLGSIVLLFGVLFSQQVREDLVRAATSPKKSRTTRFYHSHVLERLQQHEERHVHVWKS